MVQADLKLRRMSSLLRIASENESAHDSGMRDEDFINLENDVRRHDGELDTLLARIKELEEDLKTVVKYSTSLRNSVLSIASESAFSDFGPEITRCKEFRDKYQIRVG
jgi:hypothetical protein